MIKVFVYGTLLKGNSRESVMKDSKFIGIDELEGFQMFDCGSYPGIIAKDGRLIKGELYEIDKDILRELDIIEGVGQIYNRMTVNLKSGKQAFAYVYRKDVSLLSEIPYDKQPYEG